MTRDEHPLPVIDSPHHARADVVSVEGAPVESSAARMRRMVDGQYDRIWRTVRFLGVPDSAAEDVAQQVFCIAATKLTEITPGAERSFLLSTAWRVSSEYRRAARRRPGASDADLEGLEAPLPSPDELLDRKRARAALQTVLSSMPPDLRMVFVLFEIEELTLPEIAAAAGIPLGTATSRLRRARDAFQSIVKRRNAAANHTAREGCK
jgi:RNA polymerase sigma-70 factor (ECF subfamily)